MRIMVALDFADRCHVTQEPISRAQHIENLKEFMSDGPDYWMLTYLEDVNILEEVAL